MRVPADTISNGYALWSWLIGHDEDDPRRHIVKAWASARAGREGTNPLDIALPEYVRQHHPEIWVEWRLSQ